MKLLSKRPFINSLFLLATIALCASIIFAYLQISRSLSTNAWVLHTYNVIIKTDDVIFTLTDMESRISLNVLSENPSAMQDIKQYKNIINANLNELQQLTNDNSEQQVRINKLRKLIDEKINYAIDIVRVNSIDKNEAKNMAGSEKRKQIKDEILGIFTAFKNEELNLLKARNNSYRTEINIGVIELVITFIIGAAVLFLSFVLFNLYFKKLLNSQNELNNLNDRLKESEKRYLLATEGSNAGLWDWVPWSSEVYYAPYFKKMLGYNDDEFPNTLKAFEDHLHPHDSNRLWKLIRLHLNARVPFKIEYRLRNKSGEYKWFQAAGHAIWENGEPIRMLGSIIDIHEKKIAEQKLAVQHKVVQILSSGLDFETTMAKVCQEIYKILPWDVATVWLYNSEKKTLKCLYCWELSAGLGAFAKASRELELTLDVGIPGSICKSNQPIFIPEVSENERFLRAQEANLSGLHSGYFIPITLKNEIFGLLEFFTCRREYQDDELLKLLFYIGYFIGEYIDRNQSDRKLRESEIYKSAILDSAQESIITVDKDGTILSYNNQTNEMFHYDGESLKNKNIDIIIPHFSEIFTKSKTKNIMECTAIASNNECFSAELVISKMKLDDQLSFVLIVRDISERKKVEKMKNEFISLVSHELRTPLTSIQASLDLILFSAANYNLNQEVKELLEIAVKNSERLIRLINDILDIEKIESGRMAFKLQSTNINTIVQESIELNQAYAEKNETRIALINRVEDVFVNIDRDRIIQVLTNLMSNAVKYTPKNQQVDVLISKIGSFVRVSVIDKGPGISEKFQAQIFHKFAQEDSSITRAKGGTGLGLSISKAIIKHMRGLINYTTSEKGTTFYFDLPIVHLEESLPEITQNNNNTTQNIYKILYVENDNDLVQLVRKAFDGEAKIVIAKTVKETVDLLKKNDFDLVIMDLLLEDGTTESLIPSIHKKNIPILIYTAYDLPEKYSSIVERVLTKSKTSNKDILAIVRDILKSKTFKEA